MHGWADQPIKVSLPAVTALQCGGESQTIRGNAHLRNDLREVAERMMHLVADQQ